MASTSESRQRTQTTVLEGGIPHQAAQVLELVGGTPDQSLPSTSVDPNAVIAILPLEESPALPEAREINDPADWPIDVRGVPHYRGRQDIDFSTRPMGANTGEFIFLTFMFSGVQTLGYANTAWRRTIGRFTDKWMKNEIGGNW